MYYKIRAWALLDHLYKIKHFLADSLITRKYWNNKLLICIQNRCWKEAFSFGALILVEFFDRPKGDYHELIRLAEILKEIFQEKKLKGISNYLRRKLRKLHFTENSSDVTHRFFKCVYGIRMTSFHQSSVTENIVRFRDSGFKIPTKVAKEEST